MLRSGAAVALLATCRAVAPAPRTPEPAPLPAKGTSPEEYLRRYARKWVPEITNISDGREWEDAYLNTKFPMEYRQFVTNWQEQAVALSVIPSDPAKCATTKCLDAWYNASLARIKQYVPESYRSLAEGSLKKSYQFMKQAIVQAQSKNNSNADKSIGGPALQLMAAGAQGGTSAGWYINQYTRSRVPKIHNVSDGQEWWSNFMHMYDAMDIHYAKDWQRLEVQFAASPARARDCHTLGDLKNWRDAQMAHIKAFVPKAFQGFAEKSLDHQFESNKARIASEEMAAIAANSTIASQSTAAAVAFLAVPESQQPASGLNAFASQWIPHPRAGEKPDSRVDDYASRWIPHPMPDGGASPEWYINRYAGGSIPEIRNASDGKEWRRRFMSRYAEAHQHFASDSERLQREFAGAPQRARDCHTAAALNQWRDAQRAQIGAFVPKMWQRGAYKGMDGEFEANKARIAEDRAAAKAAAAKAAAAKAAEAKAIAAGSASASEPVQLVALAAVATQPAGADDYMKQYASQWMPPAGAGASPEWYMNHYAGSSVPKIDNVSDWQEWRSAFMSKYAEAYQSYADESEKLSKQYAEAPQQASEANSTKELEAWRSAQLAGIHTFIPKTFQRYAEDSVEEAFRANRARILEAAKPAAEGGNATASSASLASEGRAESGVAAMAMLLFVSSVGALMVALAFQVGRRCTEREDVGDGYMQV
mmetsp:Transcript_90754/g.282721  ORF Transcript_90754/g.282721 Transcript_90754/m.282721 type:complete len:707 (-) Transcript_90754:519-2639(-)